MKKILSLFIISFVFINISIPVAKALSPADIFLLMQLEIIPKEKWSQAAELIMKLHSGENLDNKEKVDKVAEEKEEVDIETKVENRKYYTESDGKATAELKEAKFSGDEEKGIYEFEIDLDAFGGDMYIPDSVGSSTENSVGFVYEIINNNTAFTGNVNAFISEHDSDSEQNNRIKISEDSSVNFKVTVELDPEGEAGGNAFAVKLTKAIFSKTSSGALIQYSLPSKNSKFETKKITID